MMKQNLSNGVTILSPSSVVLLSSVHRTMKLDDDYIIKLSFLQASKQAVIVPFL